MEILNEKFKLIFLVHVLHSNSSVNGKIEKRSKNIKKHRHTQAFDRLNDSLFLHFLQCWVSFISWKRSKFCQFYETVKAFTNLRVFKCLFTDVAICTRPLGGGAVWVVAYLSPLAPQAFILDLRVTKKLCLTHTQQGDRFITADSWSWTTRALS